MDLGCVEECDMVVLPLVLEHLQAKWQLGADLSHN